MRERSSISRCISQKTSRLANNLHLSRAGIHVVILSHGEIGEEMPISPVQLYYDMNTGLDDACRLFSRQTVFSEIHSEIRACAYL